MGVCLLSRTILERGRNDILPYDEKSACGKIGLGTNAAERATYSGDGGKCHALYAGLASVDVVEEVFM